MRKKISPLYYSFPRDITSKKASAPIFCSPRCWLQDLSYLKFSYNPLLLRKGKMTLHHKMITHSPLIYTFSFIPAHSNVFFKSRQPDIYIKLRRSLDPVLQSKTSEFRVPLIISVSQEQALDELAQLLIIIILLCLGSEILEMFSRNSKLA